MSTQQQPVVIRNRWWAWALAAALAALMPACKQSKDQLATPPATQAATSTQPTQASATAPTASAPAATAPASHPASQPASQPASTFSTRPPYPVQLYVHSPEEKQPGWLKIEQLGDDMTLATCRGVFPEQNIIEVETTNVNQLRIHIGYLPIGERKRIILRIDGQGIELARKSRAYVHLQHSPTGQWRILSSED